MRVVRNTLQTVREQLSDRSIQLLNDAICRSDSDAKILERQCAKILRALDRAIYECDVLENMMNPDVCKQDVDSTGWFNQ